MLLGHFGVGLAAKRIGPEVPTGLLVTAAAGPDILFGAFAIAGIEVAGLPAPWSHGLFMAGIAALVVFLATWLVSRRKKSAFIVSGLYFSHWILDFISHPMGLGKILPPDIPLFLDESPLVGLGLYNSIAAAIPTELGLFIAGIIVYLATTKPIGRRGVAAAIAFIVGMLALIPLSALIPAEYAAWACLLQLALFPLGAWMDRTRKLAIANG